MINRDAPKGWRDLQNQVGQILQECGLDCEIEKNIQTVRGDVVIDVYAEDKTTQPTTIYLMCNTFESRLKPNRPNQAEGG
jgi:restriction system protein